MDAGIYQILNLTTQKSYIGSSVAIAKRKYKHYYQLRTNKHQNRFLQNAWNKYGESDFVFRIVEEMTQEQARDANYLRSREQFYMDKYQTRNPETGYNLQDVDGVSHRRLKKDGTNRKTLKQSSLFSKVKVPDDLKTLMIQDIKHLQGSHKFRIERLKNYPALKVQAICKKTKESQYFYYDLTLTKCITFEEYTKLVNPRTIIFEIKLGSSEVIKTFNSMNEVFEAYPYIKRKHLENVLFTKNNKHSCKGHILVAKEHYDSSKVYTIKCKKQIVQVDHFGKVIEHYSSIDEVMFHYPNLSVEALRRVLITYPTTRYPFCYPGKEKPLKPSKESLPIAEYNLEGTLIRMFSSPKELLQTYPEIKRKRLDKALYEVSRPINGKVFRRGGSTLINL